MSEKKENEVVMFNDESLNLEVKINPNDDTVWLTLNQISVLFEKNKSTISRHISNIMDEGEVDQIGGVAKNATVLNLLDPRTGKYRETKTIIEFYNLDIILSVGYRVKSKRATKFRKWATNVLKDYAIKGISLNQSKFDSDTYLKIIDILGRTTEHLESKDILSVLERYTKGLTLLDDYDHQRVTKPEGSYEVYRLEYEECRRVVDQMRFHEDTGLFGREREGLFKSSIGAIYQSFDGKDVYPSVEEKTANFLYLLVKNHGFIDGNKRIAAALFVYFLERNAMLFVGGKQIIDNNTLVAITIMIAESKPKEKEIMVNLVMNFISR